VAVRADVDGPDCNRPIWAHSRRWSPVWRSEKWESEGKTRPDSDADTITGPALGPEDCFEMAHTFHLGGMESVPTHPTSCRAAPSGAAALQPDSQYVLSVEAIMSTSIYLRESKISASISATATEVAPRPAMPAMITNVVTPIRE